VDELAEGLELVVAELVVCVETDDVCEAEKSH
jgi:hypothetical protein